MVGETSNPIRQDVSLRQAFSRLADNIEAHLEQGMLRMRVPKAEGARSRVIRVQE